MPCLDALAEDDRLAALRQRRIGVGLSIAIVMVIIAAGAITGSPRLTRGGIKAAMLVVGLVVYGLWHERAERKQGLPIATDRPRV